MSEAHGKLSGSCGWKMEDRVVHGYVGLGFFNDHLLFVRIAFATCFNRKWNEHAADLFIIAYVGFGFFLGPVADSLGQDSDFQEMIWIEINKVHIAILADHLYFVGRRSIDIFASEILKGASFFLPINERSVDFRVFHQRLHIVG